MESNEENIDAFSFEELSEEDLNRIVGGASAGPQKYERFISCLKKYEFNIYDFKQLVRMTLKKVNSSNPLYLKYIGGGRFSLEWRGRLNPPRNSMASCIYILYRF